MPIYHTLGKIPRKRHIAFKKPGGGIYAEELVGHEGFTGTSALMYHIHPPTTVKSVRRVREIKFEADPDQTLHHRHFLTSRVKKGGSATLDRIPLLFNQDIAMLYVEPDENDTSTGTRRPTSWGTSAREPACSRAPMERCPSTRATTWSSIAAYCIAIAST